MEKIRVTPFDWFGSFAWAISYFVVYNYTLALRTSVRPHLSVLASGSRMILVSAVALFQATAFVMPWYPGAAATARDDEGARDTPVVWGHRERG